MRAAGAVAVVLGLVAAGLGQQPAPAPSPSPPPAPKADSAVDALVRNLGSADYEVREKAGRDLAALGDKALPQLRRALAETDSPEVARRLSVLVRKMDYERLVSPRRVSMPEKARPPREAFEEVARQTGYRIDFQGGGPGTETKLTVGFDNAPFWKAVDTLADLCGATVTTNGYDDDAVMVNTFTAPSRTPFVAYAGPFKIAATSVQLNRSLSLLGADPRGPAFARPAESVSIAFNLFSEPKNPLLGMALQPVVVAAEDDLGQPMAPPAPGPGLPSATRTVYYGGGTYRSFQLTGSLALVRGGREARTVRTVTGKVGVHLLAAVVPEVTVPEPLKAKNLKVTGRTVEVVVESVTPANNGYAAALVIRRLTPQNPNFPDFGWTSNLWQKVELVDAEGNRYRTYGASAMTSSPTVVNMTLPFQPIDRRGMIQQFGPPVRLVVNEWVQSAHDVTFEFRDVPLP